MVNPIGHWLRIMFGGSPLIPLRGLSRFRGIGFRIHLRVLFGFRVPPGLVVPSHPLTVPVCRYFEFSMSFYVDFTYLGLIVVWCQIGWCFVTRPVRFFFPSSQNIYK